MLRKLVEINQEKCDGCGLCIAGCHEGAIELAGGKAKLLRDDYCDGLGDCLPVCPTGAISLIEREAPAYNKAAAQACNKAAMPAGGCPGSNARAIVREGGKTAQSIQPAPARTISQLSQWPVQIRLVPINAPYFENANLLIAADCTAYAHADFHAGFMRGKVTLIGCPKLDEGGYAEKLIAIVSGNNIKSVTVARMEVPCCRGLENAVKDALRQSGKMIPWQIAILSVEGNIISL
ncbi:MAG: 4Fe-4S dicluster domain-containing protein [Desulfovibrio sp.]|jgi:ferredoxin|nr:4Fe-4S dicluster domain-containing protein [Desulfovibrio sp.]